MKGAREGADACCSSTAAIGKNPAPRRSSPSWPRVRWAHGINVALIGYTLAPGRRTLDGIVAEIHAGIDYLTGQLAALGTAG